MSPVARDVRAAAQLHAEAGDGDHPHAVAVLLAEQRHGAGGDRLRRSSAPRSAPAVFLTNLLVDDAFDPIELARV